MNSYCRRNKLSALAESVWKPGAQPMAAVWPCLRSVTQMFFKKKIMLLKIDCKNSKNKYNIKRKKVKKNRLHFVNSETVARIQTVPGDKTGDFGVYSTHLQIYKPV